MALFAQKLYWNVRWCELMALWLAQLTYMISHSQDITQPDLKICLNEMLRLYLVGNWNLILCGGNLGENFNPWELQWPEKHGTTFAIVAIYLFFKPNFGFHKSCLYPPRLGLEFHFLGKKGVHCYLPRSVLAPNTSFPKPIVQILLLHLLHLLPIPIMVETCAAVLEMNQYQPEITQFSRDSFSK